MKINRVAVLLLSLVFIWALGLRQAQAQRTDFQQWTLITANVSLDQEKKWLFYMEAQPRIGDDMSRLERLLIRPAIGYNINENLTAYFGYAWTPTFMDAQYDENYRNEQRIWQQLLYKHDYLGLKWQHRLREEQRIIDDASAVSNRLRYLLRGSYQFCDCQQFGLTGYNEVFVSWDSVDRGPRAGFDRDRFFFGPYWQIGSGRYEIGYLGEYGKRFGGDDRMINAIMVSAGFSL